ncbi:metabotropic glutamate receptor 3-like [Hydractinia symbiolongicarpus]|uniref:metabotropic glutamate receptor 3-like n=1 Tax=Hydractinia symbiolongicarpus TaxID=13093 RepID=UPI00254D1229|nr:metabotropic glutamate receptor 3-like [Hydractinia symbiolongicarpus]
MKTWLLINLMAAILTMIVADGKLDEFKKTLKINVMLQLSGEDDPSHDHSGIMMLEAVKYAVKKINNDSSFLNGYKLAIYKVFSSSMEAKIRDYVLDTFKHIVPFLIGPYTSELSYVTSILTGTFHQISISHSATYRDFEKFGPRYGTMLRTVPSDVYRVQAAVEFIQKMGWDYVGVVSSFGYNGEREAIPFMSNISAINKCLAMHIKLKKRPTDEEYSNVNRLLESDPRLKLVVLFTTKNDSRNILRWLNKTNHRFIIFCMYGCSNYIEVVKGIEENANGVLSLDVHTPENLGFKKYFLGLQPTMTSNSRFVSFWQSVFNCSFSNKLESICTGKEQLSEGKGYYPLTPVHTVINAVKAIADATKQLILRRCGTLNSANLQECDFKAYDVSSYTAEAFKNLLKYSFKDGTIQNHWNGNGDDIVRYDIHKFLAVNNSFQNLFIASWSVNRTKYTPKIRGHLRLHQNWETYVKNQKALCSEECQYGHIKQWSTDLLKKHCCWTCFKCPANSIVSNNTCVDCRYTEKADVVHNSCNPLPEKIMQLQGNPITVVFMLFSIVGMCLDGLVIGLFIKYNDCRFVRASGRDLCYMILFGIFIIFLSPFLFLGYPNLSTCVLRSALPGIGFLACYAPLFLKTNRIYRIFCQAQKSIQRPPIVSSRSLLLISTGIVISQILLVSVWFISDIPKSIAILSANKEYLTIHCRGDSSPVLLLLNVILSVLFMISCTVLAFKTRNFPKNYNEAKYIGITLYITCVAWSIFLPAYFLIPESDFTREYCMNSVSIIIGYVTLFGLFGQKAKMLLFQDKLINIKENLPTWYLTESKDQCDATTIDLRRISQIDCDTL